MNALSRHTLWTASKILHLVTVGLRLGQGERVVYKTSLSFKYPALNVVLHLDGRQKQLVSKLARTKLANNVFIGKCTQVKNEIKLHFWVKS